MGGMPAGELASDIVIRALTPLEAAPPDIDAAGRAAQGDGRRRTERIRAAGESDEANDGMGTTVTALLLAGDQIALLHVGDSRGYLHA